MGIRTAGSACAVDVRTHLSVDFARYLAASVHVPQVPADLLTTLPAPGIRRLERAACSAVVKKLT
jgi:hypothetical protein